MVQPAEYNVLVKPTVSVVHTGCIKPRSLKLDPGKIQEYLLGLHLQPELRALSSGHWSFRFTLKRVLA